MASGDAAVGDDRRKHLEMIQAVVARLAGASSSTKTWSVTLGAAGFAFSVLHPEKWQLALVVTGFVVFLAVLDARYLHQEKKFRRLYDEARLGDVEMFSMNKDKVPEDLTIWSAVASWSILGFYAPLFAVGFALLSYALSRTP